MAHSFTTLNYHLVFATKGREPLLDERLRPAMFARIGAVLKEERALPIVVNGMAEHVHALTKLRPDQCVADILRDVKSRTTGWVHRTRPDLQHFAWQVGYGAFTVSQADLAAVQEYIEKQEEHHAKTSFDAEFLALCRLHGHDVDERFLWS